MRHRHRSDLGSEEPVCNRLLRELVRAQRKLVLLRPTNPVVGGALFTAHPHMYVIVHVCQAVAEQAVKQLSVAVSGHALGHVHRDVAHRLETSRDNNILVAQLDGLCGKHDGFHARGADLVHVRRRD